MPRTDVIFFKADDGSVPVFDWLADLRRRNRKKALAKCVAALRLLAEQGYDLRRPTADTLRDGVHELRAREGRVNYRILYFFHGRNVAVLGHAITKEGRVPDKAIDAAVARMNAFKTDPANHTHRGDIGGG